MKTQLKEESAAGKEFFIICLYGHGLSCGEQSNPARGHKDV